MLSISKEKQKEKKKEKEKRKAKQFYWFWFSDLWRVFAHRTSPRPKALNQRFLSLSLSLSLSLFLCVCFSIFFVQVLFGEKVVFYTLWFFFSFVEDRSEKWKSGSSVELTRSVFRLCFLCLVAEKETNKKDCCFSFST